MSASPEVPHPGAGAEIDKKVLGATDTVIEAEDVRSFTIDVGSLANPQ